MSVATQPTPSGSTSRLAKRSSMDRARTSSVGPPPQQSKAGDRPRRKLQKSNPARRSASSVSPPTTHPNPSAISQVISPQTSQQHILRSPPDLSDSKWEEYLRRSGVVTVSSPALPPQPTANDSNDVHITPSIIPEFSHLALHNASPRPSLDSSTTSSPTSSTSTVSTMRRRAKTPVHTIGQLEGEKLGRQLEGVNKTSSVDLIAAQYQALLDPLDTESILTNPHSEPPLSRAGSLDITAQLKPQRSAGDIQLADASAIPIPQQSIFANSPVPSEGTLVEFDEEAIYFKPLSFSPEPPSPLRVLNKIQDAPHIHRETLAGQGNLGLQICTELLTRELAMAMLDKNGASSDTSALQILVMIEAYERLRDQVLEMKPQRDELGGVETMFDSWLEALYTLHDVLSGDTRIMNDPEQAGLRAEGVD